MKKLLLSIALLLIFELAYCQWQWINPVPPADQYMDVVHVIDQTYIVVGYFSIMRTTDGGETWEHNTIDDIPGLQTVFFFDANIGFIGGENGNLFKTINGGIDWEYLESDITETIYDIFFINADNGFVAAGMGQILKTTDGGITWTVNDVAGMTLPFYSISFFNNNIGYAGGFNGHFYKTTDGGETWSGTEHTIGHINSIHLRDQSTIIAATEKGIYKSTNNGDNWSQVLSTGNYDVYAMRFLNATIGHAVGYKSEIYKTTDGGDNWSIIAAPDGYSINPWDKGIAFEDANKGIIIDWNLHRIDLSSNSWSNIETKGVTLKYLYDAAFSNDTTVYAVGHNTIIKSSYNGRKWDVVYENDYHFFNAIAFTNENTGFAIGGTADVNVENKGLILKTTDAGNNWTTAHTTPHQLRAIYFVSHQIGFAAGQEGRVYKTTDGGLTWNEKQSGVSNHFFSISFADAQTGLICGSSGVALKTVDGGETWVEKSTGITNWLYSINFSNNGVAHAVGSSKRLIRSTDFGETWSSVTLSGGMNRTFYSVCFSTSEIGYIAGEDGVSFYTSDGGNNWTYKRIPYFDHIHSLVAKNENTVIAVGTWGAIIRNYTGPDEYPIDEEDDDDDDDNQTSINERLDNEFNDYGKIYPNPANSWIHIENAKMVEIFSIDGKPVLRFGGDTMHSVSTINISHLPNGIYIVKIQTDKQTITKKIVKN